MKYNRGLYSRLGYTNGEYPVKGNQLIGCRAWPESTQEKQIGPVVTITHVIKETTSRVEVWAADHDHEGQLGKLSYYQLWPSQIERIYHGH